MPDPRITIDRYFAAMRSGATAEADMMALFAPDAAYTEPFSGDPAPAVGHDAIRARLQAGWAQPLPDMELDVLTVEVRGDTATATWECRSPVFPGPVRGRDDYRFADGLIAELQITILEGGAS